MSTTIPVPKNSPPETKDRPSERTSDRQRMLSDWQEGLLWHKSAPKALSGGESPLGLAAAWEQWTEHLAQRKVPAELRRLFRGKGTPLDWGSPAAEEASSEPPLLDHSVVDQKLKSPGSPEAADIESILAHFLQEMEELRDDVSLPVGLALQAVAVAYRLPHLAAHLDATQWWRLAFTLRHVAQAQQSEAAEDLVASEVLVATLLGGELPLVLSVQLPEIKPFQELRPATRKFLGDQLLAATDGEGLVDACLLPVLPTLFASWTRCRAIGEKLKKNCWSGKAETQFEWLLTQTIKLSRMEGQPMLVEEKLRHWPAGALDLALDLVGEEGDLLAAKARLGSLLVTAKIKMDDEGLPDASAESEWSSLAILSNGWDAKACRALVDYSKPEMRIEIESQGRPLFSGRWATETLLDGKQLEPTGEWEQQCWSSDEDCDFLDLAIDLKGGARLERQILLGKEEGFLLLHDILHAPKDMAGEWCHHMGLPLHDGTLFAPEPETRDGRLVDARGATRAALLPLALAEWRVETRGGELASSGAELQLDHRATGARLSCPLWIDLRSKRAAKKRTWRQLTVAESLEPVSKEVAAGYRVQSGDSQWLLYRSLAPPANRTLLGQNSSAEMLIGRFLRTGELEDLIEVEPV